MQPMPASISIPRIDTLDTITDSSAIIDILDSSGSKGVISHANWAQEFPYSPLAAFSAAYTPDNLYIDFFVRSSYLRAENDKNQSPVSADSCVEVFIEPIAGGDYWNFEFNCIGAINASHRRTRPEPIRLTDDELARIRRVPSVGTKPFKEVEGMFAWNLLVVIPLGLMGIANPKPGMVLRGNFYKCASASAAPHYLSWSPIDTPRPDFHRPEYFGNIILQ